MAAPVTFGEAVREAVAVGPVLLAWERETDRSVRAGLAEALAVPTEAGTINQEDGGRSLALFVGPEGGFSEAEVALAVGLGTLTVSLGPRILRTETAGPVLAALALYEAGDLDPRTTDPSPL